LILAQILTAAGSLGGVIRLMDILRMRRREPPDQYAWYVTTALNIFHGIKARKLAVARAQLKLARKPSPPAITGEQQPLIDEQTADPYFGTDLVTKTARALNSKTKGA
jgi:hypothetical protein